jgi:hypothetical protein
VSSCPPAFAQVARRVRDRNPNSRKRCQMHSVICDHRQFIQRNFEGLSNGASRRALRRTVSQLSRPRAAIGKAAAVRCLASSANEKYIQALAGIAPSVAASSRRSCRTARRFSVSVFSQPQAFRFMISVAVEPSRGKTARCGLTIRSSGEPTARRLARATLLAYPAPRGPAVTLSAPA